MMTYNSSTGGVAKAVVYLVLLAAVIGAIAALGFSNSDFGNFFHARAEAEKIQADTAWQEQLRQIELPYVQAEREVQAKIAIAQTEQEAQIIATQMEAELARIQADTAAYTAQLEEAQRMQAIRNNQSLAAEAKLADVRADLIRVGGLALILVTAIVLLLIILRLVEQIPGQQVALQRVPMDPWHNPNFRHEQIELARRREQLERQPAMARDYTQNGSRFRKVITDPWEN